MTNEIKTGNRITWLNSITGKRDSGRVIMIHAHSYEVLVEGTNTTCLIFKDACEKLTEPVPHATGTDAELAAGFLPNDPLTNNPHCPNCSLCNALVPRVDNILTCRMCGFEQKWFNAQGEFIGDIPAIAVAECTIGGRAADESVEFWVENLGFRAPRDKAIEWLLETGAWTRDELNEMGNTDIAERVFWIACNELYENGTWYGLTI